MDNEEREKVVSSIEFYMTKKELTTLDKAKVLNELNTLVVDELDETYSDYDVDQDEDLELESLEDIEEENKVNALKNPKIKVKGGDKDVQE